MARKGTRSRKKRGLLKEKVEIIAVFIIPSIFLIIDFLIRRGFRSDLTDAGTDMALLSVSAFISALVEEIRNKGSAEKQVWIIMFLMLSVVFWLICLSLGPASQYPQLGVGFAAIIFSFIILNGMYQETQGATS